jgi:hypothetical protein
VDLEKTRVGPGLIGAFAGICGCKSRQGRQRYVSWLCGSSVGDLGSNVFLRSSDAGAICVLARLDFSSLVINDPIREWDCDRWDLCLKLLKI